MRNPPNTERCGVFLRQLLHPSCGDSKLSVFPRLWESLLLKDEAVSPKTVLICPKISLSRVWKGLCLHPNPAGCESVLHGNDFINVRVTTGGLDVKHMIKGFILLSLKYINRGRLQGA